MPPPSGSHNPKNSFRFLEKQSMYFGLTVCGCNADFFSVKTSSTLNNDRTPKHEKRVSY
jgi:hypothetical protein